MSRSTTIVSAPGKVLLAGGYLVLDPDYTGTVIATSSRFYTCISTVNKATSSSSSSSTSHIEVRSPQFENAEWGYEVQHNQSAVLVQPVASARGGFVDKNKFVEIALRKTLALARAIKHSRRESADDLRRDLEIVIVGDNDFYSQRKEVSLPCRSSYRRHGVD
jgi:phosphomevalonate kinase